MTPIRFAPSSSPWFTFTTLALVAGLAGCSSGTGGDGAPPPRPDAAPATTFDGGRRPNAADAIIKRIERLEPRAILPEAVVGTVSGSVTVDAGTRVLARRRLADGGVQREVPDGGVPGPGPGREGTPLQIGDTITTGPDGTVDLVLPDEQGTLSLGPDSTVRVSPYSVNEWVLLRGRIRAALRTPARGRRVVRIATATVLSNIAGDGAVVAVADDGATRVYAVAGTTKVRAARPPEEVELAESKMLEVNLEGQAAPQVDSTGDAVAAADEWRTERNALVHQDAAGVTKKLAKRMHEDVGGVDAALTKLRERREKNREILKRSTEARAKRTTEMGAIQEELIQNSRSLVNASDLARGTAMRILLRQELFAALRAGAAGANLGPAAAQIDALAPRIDAIREETETQFRRFPRRERREGVPGKAPRLPPSATQATPSTDSTGAQSIMPSSEPTTPSSEPAH